MKLKILIFSFTLLSILNCDTKKEYFDDVTANLLCRTYAVCNGSTPARTGIIGDSWTDLLLGFPAVETLRNQLETNHGYKFIGATLGGKTMQQVVNQGLQFQVIDQGGADVSSILLSLGGNDVQANLTEYVGNIEGVQSQRFAQIRTNLLTIVRTGNAYKQSKFGGQPIKWVIHGYDYPNPYLSPAIANADEGCETKFIRSGLTPANAGLFTQQQLDGLNALFKQVADEEPTLYYVDLRRTLGGPPISRADLMVDCIHANNLGFKLLADKMAPLIKPITNVGL
ncbi:MAG: SGNH/GDSL hydrolase family protein [Leptospira sp.]|nr:SGNH/GDSL hydrolase family protein [Leptospira sp.]